MNDREALHRAICASHQKGQRLRWETCDLTAALVQRFKRDSTLAVAQDLAVDQRTVQRWAEAGAAKSYYGIEGEALDILSPSHLLAAEWARRKLEKEGKEIDPIILKKDLLYAAKERLSSSGLREYLRGEYDIDNNKDYWELHLPRYRKLGEKIKTAYRTPEWLRDAIDTMLETVSERIET